jgi:hypothetical protein
MHVIKTNNYNFVFAIPKNLILLYITTP